jgi:hypothetical protein
LVQKYEIKETGKNINFATYKKIMQKKNVVIVGGGAAGYFCAANIDPSKYEVTILEQQQSVLQKVKISGGGRCNVSNACFDARELVKYYPRGNKELRSVFSKFQPGDTMEWFSDRGVELKIEADNRIFPVSNQSQTIIDCLEKEVAKNNTKVLTKTTVKNIEKKENQYSIQTNNWDLLADIVIFCTGSSPKSWKIIENLGIKMVEAVPSLFTFNIKDILLEDLPGTSFANATIQIKNLKASEEGPLLITHWGLSGPAILKLSAWKARELAMMDYQFDILVNFLAISFADAEEIFLEFREKNTRKQIGQSKIFDVTQRFWAKILEVCNISLDKQLSNISKKEVLLILENLCRKTMIVNGKSTFKDEFVTAGGIDLKEIDFKNMKIKSLENFFVAGETINIDAVTGGFNFQACWSEAWLIAKELNENNWEI